MRLVHAPRTAEAPEAETEPIGLVCSPVCENKFLKRLAEEIARTAVRELISEHMEQEQQQEQPQP
jgi:hypothetical protein